MIDFFSVLVMQFLFLYFRTVNVWCTAHDRLMGAMLSGLMVNVLWIATTYYGLEALKTNDILLAIGYLGGGQLGVFWGMRRKVINEFINYFFNYVKRKH
jgi:hypothetical protein